jgi:hypothetical protein
MIRMKNIWTVSLGLAILLGIETGCWPATNNIVLLRAQLDFKQTSCGQRLSFFRIGGDGSVAGPKDANGNFTIPSGQSLIITDIHITFDNQAASAAQEGVSLYIQNTTTPNGETTIWSGTASAGPQSVGYYDRTLTTGITITPPGQLCTAISTTPYAPDILVTGYLQ